MVLLGRLALPVGGCVAFDLCVERFGLLLLFWRCGLVGLVLLLADADDGIGLWSFIWLLGLRFAFALVAGSDVGGFDFWFDELLGWFRFEFVLTSGLFCW